MEKKKMSGKKKAVIILAVVLGICVLFVGIAYAVLHHYHSKSNYVKDDQVQTIDEDQLSDEDKNDVSNSMTEEEQKNAFEHYSPDLLSAADWIIGETTTKRP